MANIYKIYYLLVVTEKYAFKFAVNYTSWAGAAEVFTVVWKILPYTPMEEYDDRNADESGQLDQSEKLLNFLITLRFK